MVVAVLVDDVEAAGDEEAAAALDALSVRARAEGLLDRLGCDAALARLGARARLFPVRFARRWLAAPDAGAGEMAAALRAALETLRL